MRYCLVLLFGCFLCDLCAQDEATILAQYAQQEAMTENPAGYYLKMNQIGNGKIPQKGEYVVVNYVGKRIDGSIFDRSEPNEPFVFQVGYRQVIEGWDKGMLLFKVGGKGKLALPSRLAYGTLGVGASVPPNAPIILEIELVKVMNNDEYDAYMAEIEAKEKIAFETKSKRQVELDQKLIQSYMSVKKIRATSTTSGVHYSIHKKGKGKNIQAGNKVTLSFQGYLLNESLFDQSSAAGKKFEFAVGKNKAIAGLEEGIQYFSAKSEGVIIVPSHLAYGPRSIVEKTINIPANSVLVFKVKVEKVEE